MKIFNSAGSTPKNLNWHVVQLDTRITQLSKKPPRWFQCTDRLRNAVIHRYWVWCIYILVQIFQVEQSDKSLKWDSHTWNIQVTCILLLNPQLKSKGFNEMTMGPLAFRGIQLCFSSSLIPMTMNNVCSEILVIKGKNTEYKLNGLNQWITLQRLLYWEIESTFKA